eukprot:4884238-Pleurochrysis_carterae.AAC.1
MFALKRAALKRAHALGCTCAACFMRARHEQAPHAQPRERTCEPVLFLPVSHAEPALFCQDSSCANANFVFSSTACTHEGIRLRLACASSHAKRSRFSVACECLLLLAHLPSAPRRRCARARCRSSGPGRRFEMEPAGGGELVVGRPQHE